MSTVVQKETISYFNHDPFISIKGILFHISIFVNHKGHEKLKKIFCPVNYKFLKEMMVMGKNL